MAILGTAALLLSCLSMFLPPIASLLIMLSGVMAIMVTERGLMMAITALTLNFVHIFEQFGDSYANDWLTRYLGFDLISIFAILLIGQTIYLCILIWKWVFHFPEVNHN